MLRLGETSIKVPYIPHSILMAERLAKSPILPENRVKKNPSVYKSIKEPKKGVRAKTVGKYGSCRKGLGTAKEEYKDWVMRKKASDRLRKKLISQAKDELRHKILVDMIDAFQRIHVPDYGEEQSRNQAEEISESRSPTFAKEEKDEEKIESNFKSFRDFYFQTKNEIYPNPLF